MARGHTGAFRVHHRRTHCKGCSFHAASDIDRFVCFNRPRVKKLQITGFAHQGVRVGQACHGVFTGEPRYFKGGLYSLADRVVTKVAGAGMPSSRTDVDRHAQALITGLFDGFDLALAHVDRQARALRHIRGCSRGTKRRGAVKHRLNKLFKACAAVIEHRGRSLGRIKGVSGRAQG